MQNHGRDVAERGARIDVLGDRVRSHGMSELRFVRQRTAQVAVTPQRHQLAGAQLPADLAVRVASGPQPRPGEHKWHVHPTTVAHPDATRLPPPPLCTPAPTWGQEVGAPRVAAAPPSGGGRGAHTGGAVGLGYMSIPPLTEITEPVMKPASSSARNCTARAIS